MPCGRPQPHALCCSERRVGSRGATPHFQLRLSPQSGQFNEDMIPTVGFNMRKIAKGNVTIKVGAGPGSHSCDPAHTRARGVCGVCACACMCMSVNLCVWRVYLCVHVHLCGVCACACACGGSECTCVCICVQPYVYVWSGCTQVCRGRAPEAWVHGQGEGTPGREQGNGGWVGGAREPRGFAWLLLLRPPHPLLAQLWDIGGQPRFRSMWERYCRGVSAIV